MLCVCSDASEAFEPRPPTPPTRRNPDLGRVGGVANASKSRFRRVGGRTSDASESESQCVYRLPACTRGQVHTHTHTNTHTNTRTRKHMHTAFEECMARRDKCSTRIQQDLEEDKTWNKWADSEARTFLPPPPDTQDVPLVSVCVQGGPGSIHTVYTTVTSGSPALLVKGSGKYSSSFLYPLYSSSTQVLLVVVRGMCFSEEMGRRSLIALHTTTTTPGQEKQQI